MARYSSFLGFLEQIFEQRGQHRHFRWEIPYQYLVKIGISKEEESGEAAGADAVMANSETTNRVQENAATARSSEEKLASRAAAGMGLVSAILPVGQRSKPA
jgi:hypothetical protein